MAKKKSASKKLDVRDISPKELRRALKTLASYEAAKPSRMRKFRREQHSQNQLVELSAVALRNQARYLERNHDIARGAIRVLVNNVVGASGIGVEPQPRRRGSKEIHEEYAMALREAHRDWVRRPEVTWRFRYAAAQRMIAKTWVRDGECFSQSIIGPTTGLQHGTRVPFSLELLEPDMVPMDFRDTTKNIRQGIQRNTWGRATGYYVYKDNPLDTSLLTSFADLKFISAERMRHVALMDRIGQIRGVSEFASVITRMEDIKDYEESERVAAKIAAMMTAYVKRGSPDSYEGPNNQTDAAGNPLPREISLAPGMIIDTLAVGEEIGLIDSKRPNPNLVTFRQGQLRAMAAGMGASYSSISRDYDGTYSSQRQELVEQWIHYAVLADEFVGQQVQPDWEDFVLAAHLSGVVPIPADVEPGTHDDALFVGQSMPWIDPAKDATAWLALVQAGFASEVEVMRKRGVNPRDVLEQIAAHRAEADKKGLVFSSDFANAKGTAPAQNKTDETDDQPTATGDEPVAD
jgi:lambda family phage portal protein